MGSKAPPPKAPNTYLEDQQVGGEAEKEKENPPKEAIPNGKITKARDPKEKIPKEEMTGEGDPKERVRKEGVPREEKLCQKLKKIPKKQGVCILRMRRGRRTGDQRCDEASTHTIRVGRPD